MKRPRRGICGTCRSSHGVRSGRAGPKDHAGFRGGSIGVPHDFRGVPWGFRGGSAGVPRGFRGGSAWSQVKDSVWFVLCFPMFSLSNGGGSAFRFRHWAEPPFWAEQPPFKIKKGEISLGGWLLVGSREGLQRVAVVHSRILWHASQRIWAGRIRSCQDGRNFSSRPVRFRSGRKVFCHPPHGIMEQGLLAVPLGPKRAAHHC